jgi:cytochrome P450
MAPIPKLDLARPDFRESPFAAFTEIREQGTLYRARVPLIGKLWIATTHAAISEVLKDQKRFVRNPANAGKRVQSLLFLLLPRFMKSFSRNMMSADGPDHRRLRSLVEKAFARREVDQMQERLRWLATEQIRIATHRAKDGRIEFIDGFARPYPLAVICELLGLPAEDRAKFTKWFSGFSRVSSLPQLLGLLPSMFRLKKYLQNRFAQERGDVSDPGESLIAALVCAESEGEQLDSEELVAMVFLLLIAGHETSVYLIGNAMLVLLQRPDVRSALKDDWSLVDRFIEEVLRFASPVQFAKPRFVAADFEFHGQALKRGELVFPVLAAANFDPAEFEDPGEFKLNRSTNRHLSFGSGPHTCLGLKLARAEVAIALEEILAAWPDFAADFDVERPDWSKRMGMRSLSTLKLIL